MPRPASPPRTACPDPLLTCRSARSSSPGSLGTRSEATSSPDTPSTPESSMDLRSHRARRMLGRAGLACAVALAVLKVDGRDEFSYAKLADKPPRIGDWVLAVGNPFGLGGTVTAGIVSARERNVGTISYENFIQIDAPINKGDSGGPSFDLNGRVIGVNTMIFSPSGGSIGIAFAVPADTVRTVMPQLKEKGSVTRGWLGVQIQPVTPQIADALGLKQAQGALIAEPQADGP